MKTGEGWQGAMTLEEFVKSLVDLGKTGEHEDFKVLYAAFGEDRIRKIAREYWMARKAAKDE